MSPFFPEYKEEIQDKVLTLKTNIYLHKDSLSTVKVYAYEVESSFILKSVKDKKDIVNAHLRECLRLSKYLNTDVIETASLPLVDTLDKTSNDFLHKLHFHYT